MWHYTCSYDTSDADVYYRDENEGSILALEDESAVAAASANPENDSAQVDTVSSSACPVCGISMAGASDNDASVHVNNCLDGRPTSLPQNVTSPEKPAMSNAVQATQSGDQTGAASPGPAKQYRKPLVRPAKPGQENPFNIAKPSASANVSAFSKLMSGHAEDAAWQAETSGQGCRLAPAEHTCR